MFGRAIEGSRLDHLQAVACTVTLLFLFVEVAIIISHVAANNLNTNR